MLTHTGSTDILRRIVIKQLFETNFPKQGLVGSLSDDFDMYYMREELMGASKEFISYSLDIPEKLINQKTELQREYPQIYDENSVFYILSPGESPIKFTSFISVFPRLITKLESKKIIDLGFKQNFKIKFIRICPLFFIIF